MVFDSRRNKLWRVDLSITLSLLIMGVFVTYHGPILTAIGYAGGFRILTKFGLFMSIIGAVLTASFIVDPQLEFRSSLFASGAVLGIALSSLALLPREPILTSLEFALVYYSSVLAVPIASADVTRDPTTKLWLLLAYVSAVILAYISALSRDPQGPIGLYLLVNTVLSLGLMALLFLVVRWLISRSRNEDLVDTSRD